MVVHVRPEFRDEILEKANRLLNAECHHDDNRHKIVLMFEAESDDALSSGMNTINSWRGVLSSQLCYHHCEPLESLEEEI